MSDSDNDKNCGCNDENFCGNPDCVSSTEEASTQSAGDDDTEASTPEEYPLEETPFAVIKITSPNQPLPFKETGDEIVQDEVLEKSVSSYQSDEFLEESKKTEVESDKQISEEPTSRTSVDSDSSNIYSKISPFFVKWSFGWKKTVDVINLTTQTNFEIFYVSSHFGVIYDYQKKSMTFLPGHNYSITSISADSTGRWLVTADAGEDAVIIIWDNVKKLPVWTIYNAFPKEGTKVGKISPDARYLAAINWGYEHRLKFWLWTYGKEEADAQVSLDPSFGSAKSINFNQNETTEFSVTLDMKVIFFKWTGENSKLKKYEAEIKKHNGKIGYFRETVYLNDNETAITSTNSGQIIVWSDLKLTNEIEKKYLKTVRIRKVGITSVRLVDKIIAIACEDGSISFFDQHLKLMYWVPKFKLDPIVSIDFHLNQTRYDPFSEEFKEEEGEREDFRIEEQGEKEGEDENKKETRFSSPEEMMKRMPSDCTIEMKPFPIRDFIFSTKTGKIGYISHHRNSIKYFFDKCESPILSIACNPNKSHLITGNETGGLILYDYKSKIILLKVHLINNPITCLKYSPSGHVLTAGLHRGDVLVLDPNLLEVKFTLENTKSKIVKICFSPNSRFMAYFDDSSAVCLNAENREREWVFMGKYYSHYKPIRDIMFEDKPKDQMAPRLFTIGEDRMLVEYDTQNLEIARLKITNVNRVEQTAVPKCFTWYPNFYDSSKFLISNDEFKLKIIEMDSAVCCKTTIGPTMDGPIRFMFVIPDWDKNSKKAKMIYATDKHIGIRKLPPTGNPFEGMGMVGHAENITNMAVSHNYKYLFTTGINDSSVLMWKLNPDSIDVAYQLGGEGVEPFLPLLEGGPTGFLFKEVENFFYYAQIVHQGEQPNQERSVVKNLALCELPDLLRSLGYYPTDYEINNILYELTHLNYEETHEYVNEISFDEVLKVYLNHRPANGISMETFNKALLSVADLSDPSDIIIERDELYKALEERGEPMSHAEAVGYLNILLLPEDETQPIPSSMPIRRFADDVLGLDPAVTEENVREVTNAFETKTHIDDYVES